MNALGTDRPLSITDSRLPLFTAAASPQTAHRMYSSSSLLGPSDPRFIFAMSSGTCPIGQRSPACTSFAETGYDQILTISGTIRESDLPGAPITKSESVTAAVKEKPKKEPKYLKIDCLAMAPHEEGILVTPCLGTSTLSDLFSNPLVHRKWLVIGIDPDWKTRDPAAVRNLIETALKEREKVIVDLENLARIIVPSREDKRIIQDELGLREGQILVDHTYKPKTMSLFHELLVYLGIRPGNENEEAAQ